MINTVYYGYETKNKDSSYTKIEQNSSGQVYNTVLVMEYLFGGRKSPALFGLEIDYGTSRGQRNFTLKSNKTKIGDVLQQLNTNVLYGGNIFFSDGGEEGFNWSLGLMTGSISVKNEFQNGNISDEALKLIVKISEGSVRDALSLLDRALLTLDKNKQLDLIEAQKIFGYFDKSQLIDLFELILKGEEEKVIKIYRKIYDQGVEPKIFLNDFLNFDVKYKPHSEDN